MADRMENQRPAGNQNQQDNRSLAQQGNQQGLTRYGGAMSPYELMRRFSDDMDRMFAAMGWPFSNSRSSAQPFTNMGVTGWAPPVDIMTRGDDLVIRADLPGINPDNVNVEVDNNALIISGEQQSESQSQGQSQGYWYSERSYGSFYRRIPLPQGVNASNAQAQFNNGVLEITLAGAAQQAQPQRKQIPVRTGQQADQSQNQMPGTTGGQESQHQRGSS